jgi:RNA polymerase primary sigma factor
MVVVSIATGEVVEGKKKPTATHVGSELSQEEMDDDEDEDEEDGDDDSSDDDNSIDPELAREKFGELRTQYELARDTIKAKGRSHAASQASLAPPVQVKAR